MVKEDFGNSPIKLKKFRKPINKLEKYVGFPLLTLTSPSAAGFYLAKRKGIGRPILNIYIGACLSMALTMSGMLYTNKIIDKYETANLEIAERYEYEELPQNLSNILLAAGTNFGALKTFFPSSKIKTTHVEVKANDGKNSIKGNFDTKGFNLNRPSEFKIPEQGFKNLRVNGAFITGPKGKELYNEILGETFREEMKKAYKQKF